MIIEPGQPIQQMTPQRPRKMHPLVALLFGILTFGYIMFTAWASYTLISAGIPAEDRAGLVATITLAGLGAIATAVGGAHATGGQNPLAGIVSIVSSLRNLVRR